jgi:hypothetical protein
MSQNDLIKLTRINAQIQDLEQERTVLRDKLNHTLLDILNQHEYTKIDFETLIGGILSIKKTFYSDDESSNKTKSLWKKEGVNYQTARKKSTKTKSV